MKTSANGRALIEASEGLSLKAYQDSVHVWTIGYGHTTAAGGPAVHPEMTITEVEADQLLADDLARVEREVSRCITVALTQEEFDALVSFEFNTGKLKESSIDNKINSGNKQAAMDTLLQYNHAGGQVLNGLTRRRRAERLLFEGKVEEALKLAGSKKKVSSLEVVSHATITTATATAATQYPNLWPYIIGTGITALVVTWVIFRIKERNNNV